MSLPQSQPTLFTTDAWWHALAPGYSWQMAELENGRVYIPYCITQKAGVRFLRNPHLTPYIVPRWEGELSDAEKTNLLQKAMTLLPACSVAEWHFHPSCGIVHVAGFTSEQHHTRCLRLQPTDTLWHQLKPSLQRQIKKAKRSLVLQTSYDASVLYAMQQSSLQRQGQQGGVPLEAYQQAIRVLQEQQAGYIITAKHNNVIVAAILVAWDDTFTYYLSGGTTREGQVHGAMSALLWHAIQESIERGNTFFDFEGSRHEGIDRFFSLFGAEKEFYTVLTKNNSWLHKAYRTFKQWFQ